MLSSLLNPKWYEFDFRPFLFVIAVMLAMIVIATIKFYDEIADKGDWE